MRLDENLFGDLIGLIAVKRDGQTIYKNEFCKLKGEYTSCEKSTEDSIELKLTLKK